MKKTRTNYNIKIFTDFDGTIAVKDIGDELFKDFGAFEPHHSRLVSGEINIRDYWETVSGTLRPGLTKEEIGSYIKKFEIDAYFKKFAEYCRENELPLYIISDGFDAYIEPFLIANNLEWIPFYSNKLVFNEKGPALPVFPLATESCDCLCASCKRNAMLKNFADDDIIVFIGDGYSDFCAARHSDIVFAKKNLAAYCNENRIPHYPFATFFDVIRLLDGYVLKRKLKRRHQAHLARLKAFEAE